MASMLDRFDVQDGHTVLEIGTGYQAALLTHRLGNDAVTTVSSGLIALTVTAEDTATGQFDTEPAAFMPLHHEPTDTTPPFRDTLAITRNDGITQTATIPPQLDYPVIDFLVTLILPGVRYTLLPLEPPTYMLVDPASASWARAHADDDAAILTEHGPRMLWDELATVITQWITLGQPEVSDYSLTIDATGTHHLCHAQSGWTLALSHPADSSLTRRPSMIPGHGRSSWRCK